MASVNGYVVPEWIDENFIKNVLAGHTFTNVKLQRLDVQPATSVGDNYCSLMYRINVQYTARDGDENVIREDYLIIKALPQEKENRKLLVVNFLLESEMLEKVIPAMHELLDGSVKLGAEGVFFCHEPEPILVMEDLCKSGFTLANRQQGLDLAHSRMAISRIAVLHASSVRLHSQDPQTMSKFLTHVYAINSDTLKTFFNNGISSLASEVATWPDVGPKFSEKLRSMVQTFIDRLLKSVERDEEGFNVLNHGDAWTNNMMFRYDPAGKLCDIAFVDFQCSWFGSPAIDLLYFLYTSPNIEVFNNNYDDLIASYYSSLSETLSKLGVSDKCPPVDYIRTEMEKRFSFSIFVVICILPLVLANPKDTPDFNKLLHTDTSKSKQNAPMYFSEQYKQVLRNVIPLFSQKRAFD